MVQMLVLLIGILSLFTVVAASESDYRKYMRTRPPWLPGEVHVEEVLEVFKSNSRPSPYGVYNVEVNAFLANDFLQKRRRSSTSTTTATTTTTKTTTENPSPRPTYPSPGKDNTNPDYTDLFRPSISVTKYASYVPPQMIIIQEAGPRSNGKPVPSVQLTMPNSAETDAPHYLNEDDYLEP